MTNKKTSTITETIEHLEYNVRSLLIDPMLDALGWTFPYRRHCEVVCYKGSRADYALYKDGKYKFVVEAKKIEEKNLDKHRKQLKNYILKTKKFNGASGVLTNGYEWRIYSYENKVEKLLFKIDDITIDDINDFVESLSYDKNNLYAIVDKCLAIVENFKKINRLLTESKIVKYQENSSSYICSVHINNINYGTSFPIQLIYDGTRYEASYSSEYNRICVHKNEKFNFIENKPIRIYKTEVPNEYVMEYVDYKPLDSNQLDRYNELLFQNLTQFAANEYNVRTQIIDPILDSLGWISPCRRRNEACCKRGSKTKRVDYLLTKGEKKPKYKIVIEAKSIDMNLQEHKDQLKEYLKNNKSKGAVGILTNGFEWQVYYEDWDNPIIRTDIAHIESFNRLMSILKYDNFDYESIRQLRTNPINDECETFFKKAEHIRIVDDGEVICEDNCTDTLHKFIKTLTEEEIEDLIQSGTFDKIILTKDGEEFQRLLNSQEYEPDFGEYYITKDYAIAFKYLIIKQIANHMERKWKVEYCNKK